MSLGLGTAQFGMKYGVTNSKGQVPFEEVGRILAIAAESGIQVLDTAPAYGSSEDVLGRALPRGHNFRIVTKTPHFRDAAISGQQAGRLVEESLDQSLARLRQPFIYGLLVHRPENLGDPFADALFETLLGLKSSGKVQKIGVSVYDAGQVDGILNKYAIDLIQIPLNVFDQRLLRSGHLKKLKQRGIEIHVRSVFLQGLLLTASEQLPHYFSPMRDHLQQYHDAIRSCHLSPLQAALAFVRNLEEVDAVLCGVTSTAQMREILDSMAAQVAAGIFSDFAIDDEAMLNPKQWKLTLS